MYTLYTTHTHTARYKFRERILKTDDLYIVIMCVLYFCMLFFFSLYRDLFIAELYKYLRSVVHCATEYCIHKLIYFDSGQSNGTYDIIIRNHKKCNEVETINFRLASLLFSSLLLL